MPRGGPRPGSGRPRKAATLAEYRLTAHVTGEQKKEIDAAARAVGESVSEYLINSAITRARRGLRLVRARKG